MDLDDIPPKVNGPTVHLTQLKNIIRIASLKALVWFWIIDET
jgi:hypothetical protein